jgi:tetratricopeptide (TPR) repeat protein
MKNYFFILFIIFCTINCFSVNNFDLKFGSFHSDSTQILNKYSLEELFEKGLNEYSNYKYDRAIHLWKNVLQKVDTKKDSSLIIRANINIGSSYNALGYHKTALNYFLRTNKILEQYNKLNEPYWLNHINIGVCYMSLEQYDLAKSYFDKTFDFSPYVTFIKKLNLAKWNAIQNNQIKFSEYKIEIDSSVNSFPIYINVWNEMQLDFYIKWKDKSKLKELIVKLKPIYNEQNLYLKLLLNRANLIVYNTTLFNISNIVSYSKEVDESNDFYLKSLFYDVLKNHYFNVKDIDKFYLYSELWSSNNENLNKEKNMMYVEDYKLSYELEELKDKYSSVQLKNQLIQNQLSKSNLILRFFIVFVVMGLGIIFLLIRNYRKNKKIHSLSILKSQNELLKKEFEKLKLSESLKETTAELKTSILNIKKVALLKKQLENIADEKKPNYSDKETLKNLKLCLNSFFDNYRELTEIMQKKLNVDKIVDFIRLKFPDVNDIEIKVIEYIAQQFTTKEIAVLLDKSEKSVEYYRSQIRKKINLNGDITLEQFFNNLLNK